MTKAEVQKVRDFLRVKYKKRVFDRKTGKAMEIEDTPCIAIEFDNALACSEEVDVVLWDDDGEKIVFFTENNYNVRGANQPFGTAKPLNPTAVMVATYEQIQQMRMAINEAIFDKLIDKAVAAGMKVNFNGEEKPITADMIPNIKYVLFKSTDPAVYLQTDKDYRYTHTIEDDEKKK